MSISEDIMDGIMCQYCGVWMPEIEKYWDDKKKLSEFFKNPPGYPRTCKDCKKDNTEEYYNKRKKNGY